MLEVKEKNTVMANMDKDILKNTASAGIARSSPADVTAPRVVSADNQGKPLIVVHNLHKTYHLGPTSVHALRGVSLEVSPGEFVAVRGASGSGKSTFMNLIGCLDRPTEGSYWLADRQVSELSNRELARVRNRLIGFVFQGYNLLSRASALSNVELPMIYAGLSKEQRERRARQALHLVGLGSRMDHQPAQLSGGQQQRVAIARALVNSPALLLADEPTGNLDSRTSVEIMAVLQALNRQGLTIVLVTHEPDIAEYTTRQVTFRDGRLVRDEPVANPRDAQAEWITLAQQNPDEDCSGRAQGGHDMTTSDRAVETSASVGTKASGPSPKKHTILPRLKKEDFNRAGKLRINFSVAVEALSANRLRSLLTTLGIVIGVFSVVSMVTLIGGVSANWTDTIAGLGTNMVIIAPGTGNNLANSGVSSSGGVSVSSRVTSALPAAETTLSLTPGDATAVAKLPDVTEVSPIISIHAQVIFGNQNWNTRITGVNASLQDIQNWSLAEGTWFSTDDEQAARSVAVLGQTVYQQLFATSGEDPIGKTIRIGKQLYRVVGVLATKGGASSTDDVVFVPFSTALERLKNSTYVDQIVVKVDDASNIDAVQRNITTLLEQRHRILRGSADDFNLTSSKQLLDTFNQILSLATALYVSIASISLTVGGVGIMNIMIVSVTERTREIGIRMSLGAQRQDIRNQFLIEAVTLSLVGGVIGMLFGLLMGFGLANRLGIPFVITPTSLLMPFAVSAGVGVLFGLYPAVRAARLDPIEALRSL